ncbi:hypothetical protein B5V01_10845 [Mesorhizobium erdmanii]|uniref:Uncharacterized protein n=4 Tax=Mesorhizobium TaxID=68287 RepID=A0A3M9XEL0_9HYPH|nr:MULTISPECIES: hypothetical protein [Mesorhizobium]RNJ45790.1 hypothetical protein DNR46_09990 [Mesorhizobium japonicum]RXT47096.1 hypothetical protein B5V01_10845 [Mesorhizobium erdmanii]
MHRRIDRSARGDGLKALGGEIDYAMLVTIYGTSPESVGRLQDIVALIEAKEAEKPVARGPYKKKTA